jgi:hypothetical protein
VYGHKLPGGKGSVRRCVAVMQQPTRGHVLAHVHAVAVKRHSSMRSRLFGLPGRTLCEQSLDVKENDAHALDVALRLSRLFRSRWVWTSLVRLILSSIYIETSVRNKCRCLFYCALLTLHVSADIGGHLQVVCNTKNSKAVTVYVNGSVASVW